MLFSKQAIKKGMCINFADKITSQQPDSQGWEPNEMSCHT